MCHKTDKKICLEFRVSIADALCKHNKDFLPVLRWQPSRKQRRDTLGGAQTSLTRSRLPRAPHPNEKNRKGGCGHWPVVRQNDKDVKLEISLGNPYSSAANEKFICV